MQYFVVLYVLSSKQLHTCDDDIILIERAKTVEQLRWYFEKVLFHGEIIPVIRRIPQCPIQVP